MTINIFPHILANARMFVGLFRLLLIHCIKISVTKPTCPAFSAWLNTGSIRHLKVTGKAIMLCSMALPSKLCKALHGQSNVGSMCDCKPCRSLDLSVLLEILSGVDSDHCTGEGAGSRRNSSVYSRSLSCPIEWRSCWPKTLLSALVWLITFVNWTISSWPCKPQNFISL